MRRLNLYLEIDEQGDKSRVSAHPTSGLDLFLDLGDTVRGMHAVGDFRTPGHFLRSRTRRSRPHVVEQQVRVKGLGPTGDRLFDQEKAGWYVLAGGLRTHELELPKDACAKIRTVAIEVQTEGKTFGERFDVPSGACGH